MSTDSIMASSGGPRPPSVLVRLVLSVILLVIPFQVQTVAADNGAIDILNQKYGLFVHYVARHTVDSSGAVVNDSNTLAKDFDAYQFADDLAVANVQYVIFTAWHSGMVALWPSEAMLEWSLPNHRVNRDVIGDMITAVKARNINVYLYTHPRDGMEFDAADKEKTGWGIQPPPDGERWNPGNDFNRTQWNDFINDVYRELMTLYGDRIDGLFMDEGSPRGDSQLVVDYPRLRNTIKSISPSSVLMQNDYGNLYGLDVGMKEYGGWREFSQPDENLWPGYAEPVAAIFTETWWASNVTSTLRYSAKSMFRYTVLQAGINNAGGGIAWGAGPYPSGNWEPGVMETLQKVGNWINLSRESILYTRPSTSYPTPSGTRITDLPWGVATKSTDDLREYIHVLTPPAGQTLILPLPRDGKVFGGASFVNDSTIVALGQTINGVNLTIPGSWDPINTAIKLSVSSRAGPVPLYRCDSGHDHMDTTDPNCEASRYSKDGILGYIRAIQLPGTIPLYRCYSTGSGDHMATTESTCESTKYSLDGILGYIYRSQVSGSIPLYRCYSASRGDHMDTTDATCESSKYSMDGILGYVNN